MNDEETFLKVIRSHKTAAEIGATRMVFADWLDDQGRELDAARQRVLGEPRLDSHRLTFADILWRTDRKKWAAFIRFQLRQKLTDEEKYLLRFHDFDLVFDHRRVVESVKTLYQENAAEWFAMPGFKDFVGFGEDEPLAW